MKAQIEWSTGKVKRAYEYILEKGEYFDGATPSYRYARLATLKFVTRAKVKDCYYNAQMLTLVGSSFVRGKYVKYYEGVAVGWSKVPVFHAWNVIDGRVVDITWEKLPLLFPKEAIRLEEFQYLGVEVPLEFVRKMSLFRRRVAEMLLPHYLNDGT